VPAGGDPENVALPASGRGGPLRMRPGKYAVVEYGPAGDSPGMNWNASVGASDPEYRFELPELPPGRYRLQANVHVNDKIYWASQIVEAREGATTWC